MDILDWIKLKMSYKALIALLLLFVAYATAANYIVLVGAEKPNAVGGFAEQLKFYPNE